MQTYTQDNLKLVKSFYDAGASGDFNKARPLLDPNVQWIEPKVSGLWFRGTHSGPEAVFKEVIEPTMSHIADFRVEISQFFPVGDHVIAIGRFTGRGKNTGKELNAATAHVWTMRNGRAVRFEAFHDEANWLQALGQQRETERMAA